MKRVLQWRSPLWLVLVLAGSTLALGTGIGSVLGAQSASAKGECPESADVCAKFNNFWKVWNIAEARFLDPTAVKPDDMVAGAINGMLDSLNDQGHTRYDTAKQYQREQEQQSGKYQGIGAYINEQGGLPFIVAPIEGSPAEAAGVKAGDIITKIDDVSTEGMTIDDAVSKVRGAPNTQVKLELRRRDTEAPVTLTITRAAINVPAVTWHMLPGNVAHIKFAQFSDKADGEMQAALKAAKNAGAQKFVLDLRNNPGGLLDQAVKVTGQFLPKDAVVLRIRERGQTPQQAQEERSPVQNFDTTTSMVVLINSGSASSSEIFASALQDYKRATVIGVQTLGLGTVISPVQLNDGSAVYIGTAEWYTPGNAANPYGRPLRHQGVTPDIKLALEGTDEALTPTTEKGLSEQQILQSTDKQLLKGLEALEVSVPRTSQASPAASSAP